MGGAAEECRPGGTSRGRAVARPPARRRGAAPRARRPVCRAERAEHDGSFPHSGRAAENGRVRRPRPRPVPGRRDPRAAAPARRGRAAPGARRGRPAHGEERGDGAPGGRRTRSGVLRRHRRRAPRGRRDPRGGGAARLHRHRPGSGGAVEHRGLRRVPRHLQRQGRGGARGRPRRRGGPRPPRRRRGVRPPRHGRGGSWPAPTTRTGAASATGPPRTPGEARDASPPRSRGRRNTTPDPLL